MDAIEAIRGRRSVRDYLPRPVERGVVEAVIKDATFAPFTPVSPPDPWVFNVIEGRERIADYGARALEYTRRNRPGGPGYGWLDNPDFSIFYNAPAVVLISGKADNPLALEECTRVAMILTLSAHARGLATCWVGSPNLWLADPAVRAELGVPGGFLPYAALTIGYRARVPERPVDFEPRIVWSGGAGDLL